MARPSIKTFLKRLALTTGLVVGVPATGFAAMAVIDARAIAEAQKLLSEARKQFQELVNIKTGIDDMFTSIGEAVSITLPIMDMVKLANDIRQNTGCLVPDYTNLFPSLDFEELSFGSVCEGKAAYRQILLVPDESSQDGVNNGSGNPGSGSDNGAGGGFGNGSHGGVTFSYDERIKALRIVQQNRRDLAEESATAALALSDLAKETANSASEATASVEVAANAATTVQARLDLMLRAQLTANRMQALNTQMQAEALRLQAAAFFLNYRKKGKAALEDQ